MVTDNRTLDIAELTANRAFVSHGVSIGVRTNNPALLDRVPDYFPPGWEESPASAADTWYSIVRTLHGGKRILYQLYHDQEKLEEGFRLKQLLDCMDSEMRLQVGRRSRDKLFVHAGAVGWKGRAILIPGRSGTGKTSLVAALVRAGATYCSDEYAVLDAGGLLYPYMRPLSFRQGEADRRVRRCAVADLGGQQATEPLQTGFVVHTRYRAGARWEPRVLSSGEGALTLFGNTLSARERPGFAFSVLAEAVSEAITLEGDRPEAEAATCAILDFADRNQPSTQGVTA